VTGKSDIYSIGLIFHEMLTGQKPFSINASSYDEAYEKAKNWHVNGSIQVKNLSPEVATFIRKCTEKESFDRLTVSEAIKYIQKKLKVSNEGSSNSLKNEREKKSFQLLQSVKKAKMDVEELLENNGRKTSTFDEPGYFVETKEGSEELKTRLMAKVPPLDITGKGKQKALGIVKTMKSRNGIPEAYRYQNLIAARKRIKRAIIEMDSITDWVEVKSKIAFAEELNELRKQCESKTKALAVSIKTEFEKNIKFLDTIRNASLGFLVISLLLCVGIGAVVGSDGDGPPSVIFSLFGWIYVGLLPGLYGVFWSHYNKKGEGNQFISPNKKYMSPLNYDQVKEDAV
jgi:serine/threonine protein kinase